MSVGLLLNSVFLAPAAPRQVWDITIEPEEICEFGGDYTIDVTYTCRSAGMCGGITGDTVTAPIDAQVFCNVFVVDDSDAVTADLEVRRLFALGENAMIRSQGVGAVLGGGGCEIDCGRGRG